MDSSVSALVGTVIGSTTVLVASYLTFRYNRTAEARRWTLTKKEEAYSQSIRALLKVINGRSTLSADGRFSLDNDTITEWMKNCIEAIFWTKQLSIYSPEAFAANKIKEPLLKFEGLIEDLTVGTSTLRTDGPEPTVVTKDGRGTGLSFSSSYAAILLVAVEQSARFDLGTHLG